MEQDRRLQPAMARAVIDKGQIKGFEGPGFCKEGVSQDVSESGKKHHTVRAGRDAVSAVQLSQSLTAAIDQWAEARQINRSDAIRQLIELGLRASPVTAPHARHDVIEIEDEAISLLRKLIDPMLPIEERERRIRRLVEGPPEFSKERVDLPKHKK